MNSCVVCLEDCKLMFKLCRRILKIGIANLILQIHQHFMQILNLYIQIRHKKVRGEKDEVQISITELIPVFRKAQDRNVSCTIYRTNKRVKISAILFKIFSLMLGSWIILVQK